MNGRSLFESIFRDALSKPPSRWICLQAGYHRYASAQLPRPGYSASLSTSTQAVMSSDRRPNPRPHSRTDPSSLERSIRHSSRLYSTQPSAVAETTRDLYSSEILPSSTLSSAPASSFPSPANPTAIPISTPKPKPTHGPLSVARPKLAPPRLGPNEGRSIAVRNGDLQGALLRLQRVVAENKIKSDHHRQKFHERKGLKRKRLRSERYRKRFKEGFKKMVGLVLEMKRQGL